MSVPSVTKALTERLLLDMEDLQAISDKKDNQIEKLSEDHEEIEEDTEHLRKDLEVVQKEYATQLTSLDKKIAEEAGFTSKAELDIAKTALAEAREQIGKNDVLIEELMSRSSKC